MTFPAIQLFRAITDQMVVSTRSVEAARYKNRRAPERLRMLIEKRTDGFVELAKHSLPDLSQQSIGNAWGDIRAKIGDVLLLKDDRCRQLRDDLPSLQRRHESLTRKIVETQSLHETARTKLNVAHDKLGQKLGSDPAVLKCTAAIEQVDRDIEHCLNRLDLAESEAAEKVPGYEASSLFRYLRDRKYGSPQYNATGVERRWDRWVAKLINYDKAREGFDYLTSAPSYLQRLIDEKRDRYKELLQNLERARGQAISRLQIPSLQEHWQASGDDLQDLEEQLQETHDLVAKLNYKLDDAESIHGTYYQQSIQLYRQFLQSVEPDVLNDFAADTDSVVDDQIVLRLRRLGIEIDDEERLSRLRCEEIFELERYLSGLSELTDRLRIEIRRVPTRIYVLDEFNLPILLADMRTGHRSLVDVWRELQSAMVFEAELVEGPSNIQRRKRPTRLLEAAFLAAAQLSVELVDPTQPGYVDLPSLTAWDPNNPPGYDTTGEFEFSTLARCHSEADAEFVASLLSSHSIRCFAHNRSVTLAEPTYVMVESDRFEEARDLVEEQQRSRERRWQCRECNTLVDGGHNRCWKCHVKRLSR